ncbi:MAG TPA: TlyA family RNA methyltransferase [Anaerolineaceae bacterium]|nr:TlyA family RNA methyltransferase [Anaerolineaceae bacterium]HPN51079.1 TlyA family RNA methyltransferase [Anaerolineaceae bacterium]
MNKVRLDVLLMNRGLVESRSLAQRLVMAGEVRVNGQVASKPSMMVDEQAEVIVESGPPFVSRGGEKLEGAVQAFKLDFAGKVCADVGASTGGFTDCMLQHGAAKVYAIDVGYGILHWKLRQDQRVVLMERTNARHVAGLPEPVQMVTVDASFISLRILLPVLVNWFAAEGGEVVALIKPQFEAGREEAAHGEGVIQDPAVHRHVLEEILGFAAEMGLVLRGLICSPLKGPKGNIEFLGYWNVRGSQLGLDWRETVDQMMVELASRSISEGE